ncbi:MAG: hypothetical protein V7K69_10160 [Nostoc sp.]|uniref:hypothetical protein n=1 Tax=Nostoc sp. TaxID=1180 RepID=UPI002FF49E45
MKRLFAGSLAALLTSTTAISSIPTPAQALTAAEAIGIGAAAVGIGILAGQRNRNHRHSNHRGDKEREYRRGMRDGEITITTTHQITFGVIEKVLTSDAIGMIGID